MMYDSLQGRIVRFFTGRGVSHKLVMPMFIKHIERHLFWGHAPNNKRAVIVYIVFHIRHLVFHVEQGREKQPTESIGISSISRFHIRSHHVHPSMFWSPFSCL